LYTTGGNHETRIAPLGEVRIKRDRETERETDRQTDRQNEADRERVRDRQRDRQRDREKEKDTNLVCLIDMNICIQ
jgi:hypothetical protein